MRNARSALLHKHAGKGLCIFPFPRVRGWMQFREWGIPCEKIDGLLPGSFLPTVEFPQIKNVSLENPTTGRSAIFDNAPVKMLFAVLLAFFASQKHDLPMKAVHPSNAQGGRSALQALLETTPLYLCWSAGLGGLKIVDFRFQSAKWG